MSPDARCDVCGWLLATDGRLGCTADSCSMRPRPSPTWRERQDAAKAHHLALSGAADIVAELTAERDAAIARAERAERLCVELYEKVARHAHNTLLPTTDERDAVEAMRARVKP